MKRAKIIKPLLFIGAITATAPIVVTACSNDVRQDFKSIIYKDKAIYPATISFPFDVGEEREYHALYFEAVLPSGVKVKINKVSGSTNDSTKVQIINESETFFKIKLISKASNLYFYINVEDGSGNKGMATCKITVNE